MAFKGLRFASSEVRNTTASGAIKVAMVAISVIPLLYGALYLFAFLDPYDQLNTVPVAVVNEDEGAMVNGEFRVVGDSIVERLQDNSNGLGWHFVDAQEAQSGLENGTYYMTCVIPKGFTKAIASADTDDPEHAQLVIEYNETKNMLASQIGGTVWKEVRQQVSDSVAEEYWETVFNKVNKGADDLKKAADGAGDLEGGLKDAESGSKEITDNLGVLHDGSVELSSGVEKLLDGEGELADGTGRLSDGAQTLASGTGDLVQGTTSLSSGAEELATGTNTLASGAGELSEGAGALAKGTGELSTGAGELSSGAAQLKKEGTSELAAGTKELREKTAALPDQDAVEQAKAGSKQISDGLVAVSDGLTQLEGNAQEGTGIAYAAASAHQLSSALADTSAIDTGVTQLKDGVDAVQAGRSLAADGIAQVQGALDGAQQQVDGALAYLQAIDVASLDPQSQYLVSEAAKLLDANQGGASAVVAAGNAGLTQVANGLADEGSMDAGLQQIHGGLDQLGTTAGESLAQASDAAGQIATGLDTAVESIGSSSQEGTLLGGVAALQSGYGSFSEQLLPLVEQAPTLKAAIEQIDDGALQIDTNMETLVEGAASVASGASSVDAGAAELSQGATKLSDGATSVDEGASKLNEGAGTLADGANKLDQGAASLASGAQQVDSGAGELLGGTKQVGDGVTSIVDGSSKLADGSKELTDGLGSAVSGSDELATGLSKGASTMHVSNTKEKSEVMSSPVELEDTYFTSVKNYGTGFAPYFIALGLWVGALMGTFVFKPLDKRLILSGGNPAIVTFASYMPTALLSIVQAVLLLVVLQFALGLQIDNVPLYYAFGVLAALVFASIMQMLMAVFGFPGKFISIILLMLQLTSAAGTFPIEQTPSFFQAISPYLPMTYEVAGMRQIMTGSDAGTIALCAGVLLAVGIACFLVTSLAAYRKRMVSMTDLHPVLELG